MKTAIFVAFVCCFALALAEVGQNCKKGEDCGEDECCMRIGLFGSAKCRKLKEKGQFCFPNEDWNKSENVYRFMCPCVKGLVCKAKVKVENKTTTFLNPKCVDPNETPEPEPEPETEATF